MARRFSRQSFGVRNRSPWRRMLADAVHQFHENDLFSSAAAMSYFGLMTLFPALLLLLALQKIACNLSSRQLENYRLLSSVGSLFWEIVFALASLLLTFTLFAVVYKFLPNAHVSVRDTIPGAVIAGLLWEAAKYIFAWSLNYLDYDQIYGPVGAVVTVLIWGYVSSLVLL